MEKVKQQFIVFYTPERKFINNYGVLIALVRPLKGKWFHNLERYLWEPADGAEHADCGMSILCYSWQHL